MLEIRGLLSDIVNTSIYCVFISLLRSRTFILSPYFRVSNSPLQLKTLYLAAESHPMFQGWQCSGNLMCSFLFQGD